MMSVLSGVFLAIAGLGFDIASVLGMFYPGRDSVQVVGADGETYSYACKHGPAGETPQAQGARAHAAFEANLDGFADAFVAKIMTDIDEGTPALSTGITLQRQTDSWGRAVAVQLERDFGCVQLG